jgi:lycopene beta-cyclase
VAVTRIIVIGGGLAGSLAALALAKRRPDIDLLLIEQGASFGGNHTWSFFDTDVAPSHRWVIEGIAAHHWPDHEVRFPRRRRVIPIGYNSIRSDVLDSAVKTSLAPDQYRLGQAVEYFDARTVRLANGEEFETDAVIDARGPRAMPGIELGWQKFIGRIYRATRPHAVHRPVIMDATIPQQDGYRFLYLLPLNDTDLLIEDTYYSADPALDEQVIRQRLDDVARGLLGKDKHVQAEETGVLPIVIRGELEQLWPEGDRVPRLGIGGGFFHPTTSYSLPDAVANAALLAEQGNLDSASINTLLRRRSERLWRERRFYQRLNRMLFHAAAPEQRYRVLEHFYRLPDDLIARFYAGQTTTMDKLRIVSGRPPVSVRKALAVLFRTGA